MSRWLSIVRLFIIALITANFIAGCASQNILRQERYFWPPPPNTARIEWLHAYKSQLDIEKTGLQRFFASISGDDQPIPFVKPLEIKSIPELQRFYVTDIGRPAVVVYDLGLHEARTLETPAWAPAIRHPISIAYDTDFNLYLLEQSSNSIIVFNKSEKCQRVIKLSAIPVVRPVSMSLDRSKGRLYIADGAAKKIHVLDLQGRLLFSFGSGGDGDGRFNLPIGIAVNSLGEIIVADAFNVTVQIFSSEGKFISKFGNRGDGAGDFQLIKSIAVDSENNIYVVDSRSHNISIFNRQGELLLVLGGYYVADSTGKLAPGGFSLPIGIDIDSTDKIFVVDQLNARVQVFQYLSPLYLRSLRRK